MVNLRAIGQKFTKSEAKDLLDKAQNIIEKDVLGPNFKREKLLSRGAANKIRITVNFDLCLILVPKFPTPTAKTII